MRSGCKSGYRSGTANIVGRLKSRSAPLLDSNDTTPEAGREVRIDMRNKTFPCWETSSKPLGREGGILGGIDCTAGLKNSRLEASQQAAGSLASVGKIERNGEAFAWKGQQANGPT